MKCERLTNDFDVVPLTLPLTCNSKNGKDITFDIDYVNKSICHKGPIFISASPQLLIG